MAPLGYLHLVAAVTVGCPDGFDHDPSSSQDAMRLSVKMTEAGLSVIRSNAINGLDLTMAGIGTSVDSVDSVDSADSVDSVDSVDPPHSP